MTWTKLAGQCVPFLFLLTACATTSLYDEAADLFDRMDVVEVRFTLPQESWTQLIVDARNEAYTKADVTIMGETFHDIGLRFRGSWGSLHNCFDEYGALICDKLAMKLKFNEYIDEQRFMGLKRLNFQGMQNDPSKMREVLAYDVFREMDIISSRAAYAFVYINDEVLGLYGLVEQVDGRFTASRFERGNGNLYKEAWPKGTSGGYYHERLKTNRDNPNHDQFYEFAEQMRAADDTTLSTVLNRWMDVNYLMRYMAVDYAIANWDGVTAFYNEDNHNYYMYQDETWPFFWIIPWDLEATFQTEHWWTGNVEPWDNLDVACNNLKAEPGTAYHLRPAGCDPTIRAIVLADRAAYKTALAELLKGPLSASVMSTKINTLTGLLTPYVEADPDLQVGKWREDVASFRAEFEQIRKRVADTLSGNPWPPSGPNQKSIDSSSDDNSDNTPDAGTV